MSKVSVRALYLAIGVIFCGAQSVNAAYGDLAGAWQVDFGSTEQLRLETDQIVHLQLRIYNVVPTESLLSYRLELFTRDAKRAEASLVVLQEQFIAGSWQGSLPVTGRRFGYTELLVRLHGETTAGGVEVVEQYPHTLSIAVERAHALDERITTYVATAVLLLMFLNLGTVLDIQRLRGIICRPVGPLVGFCCRYLLMPALAIGLGRALWPQQQFLQLALFYSALAPSGGLANICTVFLKGNVNLSIATTTINSLLALGMLPLWIMLLGRIVFEDDQLGVPFVQLAVCAVALIICLALGLTLRLCIPKTTRFIFRLLKPLSVLLALCLICLTVGLNTYVFSEFTWRVLVAAICLPLAGYLLSYLLSKLLCRSATDALTLSVEASVLNMTLPIALLQSSRLEQPQLDLILVVPIASALISLLLVLLFYVVRRIGGWNVRKDLDAFDEKQFLVENNDASYER